MGVENTHLCLAIRNCHYYETLIMGNPIVVDANVGKDCFIRAPAAPGIGHDIDAATLEKIAVAKI
jgi:L-alanine-DL-glutamate epimerase-like enolase superfamily enzyme